SSVRRSVAQALGQLAESTVAPELLAILKDRQDDSSVRRSVAQALITLGQQETVFPYLSLIVNNLKDGYGDIPSEFIWNIASLRAFTPLLKVEDTYRRNTIHRTFWAVSQREKVRILIFKWRFIKFVRVVRR